MGMKAVRVIALIALIAIPSSSYAWSRGRAVVVRPGFPSRVVVVQPGFANRVVVVRPAFPGRFVAGGFVGGVTTGIVLNPFFVPRSFYLPGPYIYYYPPSRVYAPGYYPPSYSVPPSIPPAPAPSDAYDRGYSEGYAQ